ncbi:hypothetical protein [Methylobacterium sp. WL116]|uniref:hypothetical protein n=1 Tax=Methylobacterium sp. WL116 TaxID=2603889 RepID=UPI0011C7B508|nr:hypothetical protein [Methylobacterium sp. WL116]TXM94672.1 hypothetical protein FV223_03760 [Methylobacterium sp. WL116]
MTYTLHQLAAGSYDLALDGVIVGDVVRDVTPGGQVKGWRAELLDDVPVEQMPLPFSGIEHRFPCRSPSVGSNTDSHRWTQR